MALKKEFSQRDFIEILSNYNLGDFEEAKPISQGTVQTTFLLQTGYLNPCQKGIIPARTPPRPTGSFTRPVAIPGPVR